ncbi:hypothetical protein [Runella sp.]|uniref:hypothetical protein n=1 Tax=Runella sp. TaxID=1960881 RepID=UPI0026101A31|nr:hypothetical protein [Runella sp.]
MKIKMNWRSAVSASILALTMVACNQNSGNLSPQEELTADDDNQMIVEETEAVFSYNEDLFGGFSTLRESGEMGTDSAGIGNPGKRPLKNDKCATITRSESNGIITIVVDYGAAKECDGKKVGGKMTIQIPLKPDNNATGLFTQTITYENFQRGPRTINGKHTVNVVLENGRLVTKENFTKTTITTENGITIQFNSTKTRKTDNKGTLLNVNDDEIIVTGNTTATGSDGKTFASAITKAITIKVACKGISGIFPVAGTVEIERTGKSKVVIDYGDGTCDRTYTLTSDGKTVTKTRK